ncbi:MAG TPA: hypothetical protein VFD70_31045, partial [Anaerolineae bacterium]|nr:hypothetical protein [Anaerolineae bacterium]
MSVPEGFARTTALVLVVILIIAFILLISLFSSMQGGAAASTPTIVAIVPSATLAPSTNTLTPTSTATATATATLIPSPTLPALVTPTVGCPIPATPEPLWVDPVISPTNQLSQILSITLGRGREITVQSEAGVVKQQGNFSTALPAQIQIPLLPNTTHNIIVTGQVEYAPGCFYTLQTRTDRNGAPLIIVQQSSAPSITLIPPQSSTFTPPPPPTFIVTPLPTGLVYLKPFSQVFAINQPTPNTSDTLWLYEANDTTPFQVYAQQGAFTHLVSQNGSLNFWTLNENVMQTPPIPPRFDTSVAGQTVQLVGS